MRRIVPLVVLLAGCGSVPNEVRWVDQADTLTVYSLDCGPGCGRAEPPAGAEMLHGYAVLGKVTVPADRRAEVAALVRESIISPGRPPAKCYWPRHAIRTERGGAVTGELLICYACGTYGAYTPGSDRHAPTPAIGLQSKAVLNDLLTAAGVPLCPESGEN